MVLTNICLDLLDDGTVLNLKQNMIYFTSLTTARLQGNSIRDKSYRCVVLGVTDDGAVANNWVVGVILHTCQKVEARSTLCDV